MRYIAYFLTCLLLSLAPGPDNCFVLTQSVSQGMSAGIVTTLGLCTGLCVHVTLALLGFAALVEKHPRAIRAISFLGGLYLLYIAWQMLDAPLSMSLQEKGEIKSVSLWIFYGRGILLNLCNPKIILFFLAFFPKFINQAHQKTINLQILTLGLLFIVATLVVFCSIAVAGGGLESFLLQRPKATQIIQYAAAIAVAGIGLWTFVSCLKKTRGTVVHS